jgi:LacI family transcriptional regulator
MRLTIRDVARQLHLSITTVSRALDGYTDVAPETRKRVIETAQQMGYTPNRAARQLRRKRTDTIGYIIPANHAGFADPFFSEFIAGLGDEASAHGYDLLVTTASPASPTEKTIYERWVQGGKVDGMIVNRIYLEDWRLQYLAEQKMPHVSLERSLSPLDFVGIEADSFGGFLELVNYLLSRGHTRVAYIGGAAELKIDHDRYKGYLAGLDAAHIIPDTTLVVRADLTAESGYDCTKNLLKLPSPPTAIICVNDLTAIGAMHAAHEHGLRVGRDIAIAGFDGIADAAHTQPPLTTLDQPVYAIARRLVMMLMALIHNKSLEARQVKIRPKLMIRESTGG